MTKQFKKLAVEAICDSYKEQAHLPMVRVDEVGPNTFLFECAQCKSMGRFYEHVLFWFAHHDQYALVQFQNDGAREANDYRTRTVPVCPTCLARREARACRMLRENIRAWYQTQRIEA